MVNDSSKSSWQAAASLDVLQLRASTYQNIREFFSQRQVLEVDTPVLSVATTPDPNIHSFITHYLPSGDAVRDGFDKNSGEKMYLSTSPEFHMKRLLASGSGSIYQLCHVFRQSELGAQHNPEFTLLEWYRVGFGYQELMVEVAALVELVLKQQFEIEYITYQQAFINFLDIDPLVVSIDELKRHAESYGLVVSNVDSEGKDLYLDFLMSHQIQPKLGKECLTFIYEYPASQCALARLSPENNRVAERFELFLQGVELANGYHELIDAQEQQLRFERQQQHRVRAGHDRIRLDRWLVEALEEGMPPCSGVALGMDRLFQLILGAKNLDEVLAFAFNRA